MAMRGTAKTTAGVCAFLLSQLAGGTGALAGGCHGVGEGARVITRQYQQRNRKPGFFETIVTIGAHGVAYSIGGYLIGVTAPVSLPYLWWRDLDRPSRTSNPRSS